MRTKLAIRTAGAMLLLSVAAAAQQPTIRIWPGAAPGSEDWSQPEGVMKGTDTDRVVNVVTPTLTAYLPEKGKATGTGVIIAPGGGFSYLAIDKEGHRVASWLQEKGIAGFVLKYRVRQMTPEEIAAIQARRGGGAAGGRSSPGQTAAPGGRTGAPAQAGAQAAGGPGRSMDDVGRHGIADGMQALKLLQQRAGEFGLSPDRIGIVGFSAGAMVASGVLLQGESASRPAFAAPIYGGPFGAVPSIPQNLPPVFLAWAQDDSTAGAACARFYTALTAAGSTPEVHIYRSGGHGFGMAKQGTTSDHWIDEFYYWLEAQGLTTPAVK
jgi:acetyl esterase/lipase